MSNETVTTQEQELNTNAAAEAADVCPDDAYDACGDTRRYYQSPINADSIYEDALNPLMNDVPINIDGAIKWLKRDYPKVKKVLSEKTDCLSDCAHVKQVFRNNGHFGVDVYLRLTTFDYDTWFRFYIGWGTGAYDHHGEWLQFAHVFDRFGKVVYDLGNINISD